MLVELESHVEMHEEEQNTEDSGSSLSPSPQRLGMDPELENSFGGRSRTRRNIEHPDDGAPASNVPSPDRHTSAQDAWRKVLKMPPAADASSEITSTPTGYSNPVRRRLGVRLCSPLCLSRGANQRAEIGAGPPSCGETDAIMASQGSRERRRVSYNQCSRRPWKIAEEQILPEPNCWDHTHYRAIGRSRLSGCICVLLQSCDKTYFEASERR